MSNPVKPVKICRHCGTEFQPGAAKCPMCWEPVGWHWFARILRRGLFWGLLVCAPVTGFVWVRDFLSGGEEAQSTLDEVTQPLSAAERACASPSCPPHVLQARVFYDAGRKQLSAGRGAEALKSAKAALELLRNPPQDPALGVTVPIAAAPTGAPDAARAGMVQIAPGEFPMGSFEVGSDERPAHAVSLGGYSIAAREVTVEEYRRYSQELHQSAPEQPAWSTPQHPVVFVTWHEAKAYCEHRGLRLPTEAEWERAARCGGTKRSVGDGSLAGLGPFAWYKDNSRRMAHPVGSKSPNACLLYDVFGNAAEWVADWYAPDYYADSPAQNPLGPDHGDDKVVRGGAFDSPGESLSVSFRDKFGPESGREDIGFRCAK